jgi:hypothetical protein
MSVASAELARTPKAGLQRSPSPPSGPGYGTPAPGEGYALTIAHHVLSAFSFENEHDRHDVELAVGLVAAKRASLVGRGPIPSDVRVTLHLLGIEGDTVSRSQSAAFAGVAHSYVAQRRFVDAVAASDLVPGSLPH